MAVLAVLYMCGTGLLLMRVSLISLFPNRVIGGAGGSGVLRDVRTRADLEHFKIQSIQDGRGHILYRDGRIFPPRRSQLVGWVGLPDVWPAKTRMVREQGREGLEDTFDSWLQGRPGFIGTLADVTGRQASSVRYHVPMSRGADVRTTVDASWEARAERALEAAHVKNGAVVILSARSHEVLALSGVRSGHASYLPAVTPRTPGSIFKLVTAAAALESYEVRSDQPFLCDGDSAIHGVGMRCWRVHGRLSFAEAIAQSCDVTFANVGLMVGGHAIANVASAIGCTGPGLQRIDGHLVLKAARAGEVFAGNSKGPWTPGELANTAIGQQDVSLSPLGAANLAAVVADGGRYEDAQLIMDAQKDGRAIRWFPSVSRQAIRRDAATELANAMREAVTSPLGTAHALDDAPTEVAVKTGTAELGGTTNVNAWIIGFAPYRNPTIAFAVYVGDAPSKLAHHQVFAMTRAVLRGLK